MTHPYIKQFIEFVCMSAESHFDIGHLTITVLCDDELCEITNVIAISIGIALDIVFGTVDEANDIGILLDCT